MMASKRNFIFVLLHVLAAAAAAVETNQKFPIFEALASEAAEGTEGERWQHNALAPHSCTVSSCRARTELQHCSIQAAAAVATVP